MEYIVFCWSHFTCTFNCWKVTSNYGRFLCLKIYNNFICCLPVDTRLAAVASRLQVWLVDLLRVFLALSAWVLSDQSVLPTFQKPACVLIILNWLQTLNLPLSSGLPFPKDSWNSLHHLPLTLSEFVWFTEIHPNSSIIGGNDKVLVCSLLCKARVFLLIPCL